VLLRANIPIVIPSAVPSLSGFKLLFMKRWLNLQ
jgi:hypothetical protein